MVICIKIVSKRIVFGIFLFFIFLLLSIKPFLIFQREGKEIFIDVPDGLSYNVSTKKIPRVFFTNTDKRKYSSSCREVVNKEDQICTDFYSGDDFVGYNVKFISFSDKNDDINNGIIISGKFINVKTGDVLYVKTSLLDIEKTKIGFHKIRYIYILIIFVIFFCALILFFKNLRIENE